MRLLGMMVLLGSFSLRAAAAPPPEKATDPFVISTDTTTYGKRVSQQIPATENKSPVSNDDQEAHAIALLFKEPTWSVEQIAEAVRVDRKTPYRWLAFRTAAERCGLIKPRGKKNATPRRGYKTADGHIEAIARQDDDD